MVTSHDCDGSNGTTRSADGCKVDGTPTMDSYACVESNVSPAWCVAIEWHPPTAHRFWKIGTTFVANDGVGTRVSGAPPVGSTGVSKSAQPNATATTPSRATTCARATAPSAGVT